MHRRLRADVVEGQDVIVLVDLLARDLAAQDAGEDVAADRRPSVGILPVSSDRIAARSIPCRIRVDQTGHASTRCRVRRRSRTGGRGQSGFRAGLFRDAADAFAARPARPRPSSGRDAGLGPQHQQVVEQVGAFADQRGAVAAHRLDHRLDRLLAELLGDLRPGRARTAWRCRRSPGRRRGATSITCRTAGRAAVAELGRPSVRAAPARRPRPGAPWPRRCG